MRYESFGPVSNPDGTPSAFTKSMLQGTGRSLEPPFNFVDDDDTPGLTCPICGSTAQGELDFKWHLASHDRGEDAHLESDYEDRFTVDGD